MAGRGDSGGRYRQIRKTRFSSQRATKATKMKIREATKATKGNKEKSFSVAG